MKKLLDDTYKLFPPKVAEKIAKELKANDPDWNYVAVHDPKGTGQSFINIFDEDNILIGRY